MDLANQTKNTSIRTVIINSSLEADYTSALKQTNRVRVSDTTTKDTLIFPSENVAFLMFDLKHVKYNNKEGWQLYAMESLNKFASLHRNAVVILSVGNLMDSRDTRAFKVLQQMAAKSKVLLIPVHNLRQSLSVIDTTLLSWKKSQNKETVRLQQDEVITNCLQKNFHLTKHEATILWDGCKTLKGVITATKNQLCDVSLDGMTAERMVSFFENDTALS